MLPVQRTFRNRTGRIKLLLYQSLAIRSVKRDRGNKGYATHMKAVASACEPMIVILASTRGPMESNLRVANECRVCVCYEALEGEDRSETTMLGHCGRTCVAIMNVNLRTAPPPLLTLNHT